MAARSARRASADGSTAGNSEGHCFAIAQAYQFNNNPAYRYRRAGLRGHLHRREALHLDLSMIALGGGGVTVLGAVDSIPLTGILPEEPPPTPVKACPQGPATTTTGQEGTSWPTFILRRDNTRFVNFGYELHHLHSPRRRSSQSRAAARASGCHVAVERGVGSWRVDGVLLTYARYYADDAGEADYHFPQYRVFLTWTIS